MSRQHRPCSCAALLTLAAALGLPAPSPAAPPEAAFERPSVIETEPGGAPALADAEFFEARIRPLLVRNCWNCHSGDAQVQSGLRLDGPAHLLAGGERGAVVVPGNPEASLLIRAVTADPALDLKMPPNGQLSPQQIDDLRHWIARGAVWPEAPLRAESPAGSQFTADDLGYWAFQPITRPSLPEPSDRSWVRQPIDHFVLEVLAREGLEPAPPADRHTLLRRVTYDLIGLPPTPEEIECFLADSSPDAYERVVERLLASPHYGERWARHWLDVVGYAETDGHEYDQDKPHAWRYRDYVIEAFNRDLPFDRFIVEHFAGDLLPDPRATDDGAHWLSPLATGFFWFSEIQNVPVDLAAAAAARLEKQIDVIGKGFLGLTLACARCHDHKFDPITSDDYYALGGYLASSRQVQACVDTSQRSQQIRRIQSRLQTIDEDVRAIELPAREAQARRSAARLADYLLAASELQSEGDAAVGSASRPQIEAIDQVAVRRGLDHAALARWRAQLEAAIQQNDPLFYVWARLGRLPESRFAQRAATLAEQLAQRAAPPPLAGRLAPFEDFEQADFTGWTAIGEAFGDAPGEIVRGFPAGFDGRRLADSFRGSAALTGRLLSDPFWIKHPFVNFLVAGGDEPWVTCVNVLINGQALPELTVTGGGSDEPQLKTIDLHTLIGRQARIELVDESRAPGGYVRVDGIFFSDQKPADPPKQTHPSLLAQLSGGQIASAVQLAAWYQAAVLEALDEPRAADAAVSPALPPRLTPAERQAVRRWALGPDSPLLEGSSGDEALPPEAHARLAALRAERAALEAELPSSTLALVTADAAPRNLRVHLGGDPQELGAEVPRRAPAIFSGGPAPGPPPGSGRLELARWLASPAHPLTARVLVNRVWRHHFGRGIVATVDNFGRLGEPPSHPELLDFLAGWLIDEGWSLKKLHRMLVASATYRQSSQPGPEAAQRDPDRRLLSHMPLRRLEAECIRDAMLAVSGQLDRQLYGPSVRLHLTPFMDGRDLPAQSGPLDGDRRRSIYLEVRRNHLTPLLAAFDFPKPESTVGRRNESVVAPQALMLLNNELVRLTAEAWARRVLSEPGEHQERIARMHLAAFGRPAPPEILAQAGGFLAHQIERQQAVCDSPAAAEMQAWADLCQVFFGLAEFYYVH